MTEPIMFTSAQVERSRTAGTFVLALFDGAPVPACVALLECSRESAVALHKELGSALETPDPEGITR